MSKETHSVKSHIWRGGRLTVFEEFFDSFELALNYSRQTSAQTSKIYSHDGDLVHTASIAAPVVEETYA
jgi:hypothetical protein